MNQKIDHLVRVCREGKGIYDGIIAWLDEEQAEMERRCSVADGPPEIYRAQGAVRHIKVLKANLEKMCAKPVLKKVS